MDQPADPAAEERPRCPHCGLSHDLEPGSLPAAFCASIRTDVKRPETENTALCVGCGHKQHRPGTECETRVDHGPSHFHSCLCLNLVDAERACPAQMTCQGGTLGYADIWYLQRGHSLASAGGVITPNVLKTAAAGVVVQQSEPTFGEMLAAAGKLCPCGFEHIACDTGQDACKARPGAGVVQPERPRCPDCQMPHDLTPGSLPLAMCVSTRQRIADAEQLHSVGDHHLCCRADCDDVNPQPEPDTELTAGEARDAVSDLGIDLYRAQDTLAFVGECCDIADRDGLQPTTGDVREWLKGARCGRELLAGQDQPEPGTERRNLPRGTPGVGNSEVQSCRSEEGITVGLVDALITVLRVLAPRDLSTKGAQEALTDLHEDPDLQTVLRIKAPDTGTCRCATDRMGPCIHDLANTRPTEPDTERRVRYAAPVSETVGMVTDFLRRTAVVTEPDSERHERYAAAMRETDGWVLDDGQHMLNAVVAVGAAEIARVQQLAKRKLDQAREKYKAGLRQADEQLREMNAELERYAAGDERPVLWSVYNRMHGRAASAEAEAKSLRAELATTRKDAGWLGAARFLRRTPQTSDDYHGALRGARLIETELRRLADEEQQPTTTGLAPAATRTNETAATVGEERSCGYGNPHLAHKYLRMEVQSQCPGVPDEPTAWTGATELASDRMIAAVAATGIVGYQQDQGRLLHCLAHKPAPASRYADFHEVTADDLDDGGICVHPRCGRDLLIPWPPVAPTETPTS